MAGGGSLEGPLHCCLGGVLFALCSHTIAQISHKTGVNSE